MLRLKFCGPNANPCVADDIFAIGVGFEAQIDTHALSIIGGVTGRYPSRLSVTPDLELRTFYNETELRDLRAYELKLTEREKDRLLAEVTHQFWEGDATYRYFTNNCAGGMLDLLTAILPPDHRLRGLSRFLLAPRGLLVHLRAYDLTTGGVEVWRSRRAGLESRMRNLRRVGFEVPRDVARYRDVLTTRRREWIERAGTLADLMVLTRLEAFALRSVRTELLKNLVSRAERESGPCAGAAADVRDAHANINVRRLKTTPGVPVASELLSEEDILQRYRHLDRALGALLICYAGDRSLDRARARERQTHDNLNRARVRAVDL